MSALGDNTHWRSAMNTAAAATPAPCPSPVSKPPLPKEARGSAYKQHTPAASPRHVASPIAPLSIRGRGIKQRRLPSSSPKRRSEQEQPIPAIPAATDEAFALADIAPVAPEAASAVTFAAPVAPGTAIKHFVINDMKRAKAAAAAAASVAATSTPQASQLPAPIEAPVVVAAVAPAPVRTLRFQITNRGIKSAASQAKSEIELRYEAKVAALELELKQLTTVCMELDAELNTRRSAAAATPTADDDALEHVSENDSEELVAVKHRRRNTRLSMQEVRQQREEDLAEAEQQGEPIAEEATDLNAAQEQELDQEQENVEQESLRNDSDDDDCSFQQFAHPELMSPADVSLSSTPLAAAVSTPPRVTVGQLSRSTAIFDSNVRLLERHGLKIDEVSMSDTPSSAGDASIIADRSPMAITRALFLSPAAGASASYDRDDGIRTSDIEVLSPIFASSSSSSAAALDALDNATTTADAGLAIGAASASSSSSTEQPRRASLIPHVNGVSLIERRLSQGGGSFNMMKLQYTTRMHPPAKLQLPSRARKVAPVESSETAVVPSIAPLSVDSSAAVPSAPVVTAASAALSAVAVRAPVDAAEAQSLALHQSAQRLKEKRAREQQLNDEVSCIWSWVAACSIM